MSAQYFGTGVHRRQKNIGRGSLLQACFPIDQLCDTEIKQLRLAFRRYQHVAGFQVAMDYEVLGERHSLPHTPEKQA